MKKEISAYMETVKQCIRNKKIDGKFLEMLLTRIKFYQHERLIHLIVTMTFAIMTVLSFFMLVRRQFFFRCCFWDSQSLM